MSIHKISLMGCGLTVFAHKIDGSQSGSPLYSANKGVAYMQVQAWSSFSSTNRVGPCLGVT